MSAAQFVEMIVGVGAARLRDLFELRGGRGWGVDFLRARLMGPVGR